ncbi:MAG: hypothetical protein WA005_02195 [Candidatus Binataceae bacterium]
MRRLPIVVLALLLLGVPALSRADEYNQTRTPQEYDEDDSNPVRVMSYFLTPVGFVLEWTIARPLHYLATETFLAPAMDSEYSSREEPLPVAELPTTELYTPDVGSEAETAPQAEQATHVRPRTSAPAITGNQESAPPPAPAASPGQPVLH